MKLREYLDNHSKSMSFFAYQVGINYTACITYVAEAKRIPERYWKKIVEETGGEVTIVDLFESGPPADAVKKRLLAKKNSVQKLKKGK